MPLFPPPGGGAGSVNVSAGTTSNNLTAVTFSNANGVSFGLNGSVITGTVATNYQAPGAYLTTAMASNRGSDFVQATAAFAGTSASGTIASNGISISIGPYITTGMLSNAVTLSNIRVSAGTTSNLLSAITFSNGSGISFGLNGSVITGTVQTNYLTTAAQSDHSHGNPTLALTNLSGTTASASNGFTLSLSAAAPGAGGGFAAQGSGAYTQNTGTIQFANSNGITFGLSTNQMTASHNGLTTAAQSNHSHGNPTLNLTNLSGTTASASNGFTLSLSGPAPGGGADKTISFIEIADGGRMTTCALWNNATYSQRPIFVPFQAEHALQSCGTFRFYASRTGGTSAVATVFVGVYTRVNATSMNLLSSTSNNFSMTTSAQFSGIRIMDITGLGALSLSPGGYVLGLMASIPGTASWGLNIMGGDILSPVGFILPGTNSTAATHSQSGLLPFWGVFNATSGALPAAVGTASISGGNGVNSPDVYGVIKAI